MSYLALYRKYRPNNFSDLVGQNEIANIIKNEILNNKLSHAYLFSGPRGTGKTSTAKIIARMINCNDLGDDGIPCGKCESCIHFFENSDIIEIDAASNNGVDEIRELRDKVNLVPTYGKYKVYIIDEVHMLTSQAFNALLKTLEEPPSHVIFILATTEFYKIPETIVSRCQKFQFSKFSLEDIVDRLRYISNKEKINATDDVLFEIARLSDGGLRDAINMLDQLSSFNDTSVTLEDVYKLNGVVSYVDFYKLLFYMNDNDWKGIIEFFEELDKNGKNFGKFIEDLISFVSEILIYSITNNFKSNITEKNDLIEKISNFFSKEVLYDFVLFLNELFFKMKNSSFVNILLSTEFIRFSSFKFCSNNDLNQNNVLDNKNNIIEIKKKDEKITLQKQKIIISEEDKKIRINNAFSSASKKNKESFLKKWNNFKKYVMDSNENFNVYSLLNDIEVLVVGNKDIIFLANYDSILIRLYDELINIENVLNNFYDNNYKIIFLTIEQWNYEKQKYISNIKNGVKYNYICEKKVDNNRKKVCENIDDDVNKITSILGENVISFD